MKQCCIVGCDNPCEPKRRYCRKHYLEIHRQQAKIRYKEHGGYTYKCICCVCGRVFDGDKKTSKFCSRKCYSEYRSVSAYAVNGYERAHGGGYCFMHRKLAEGILGKLGCNIVVHHIDGNVMNNALDNLLVLPRSDHAKLHYYLNMKQLSFAKNKQLSDDWEALAWPVTESWLKLLHKPYIRLDRVNENSPTLLRKMQNKST